MGPKFNKHHGGWIILGTLVLAALFTVLPLPDWLEAYRPEWVALVVIYWVVALPDRIGLFSAWITGFFHGCAGRFITGSECPGPGTGGLFSA